MEFHRLSNNSCTIIVSRNTSGNVSFTCRSLSQKLCNFQMKTVQICPKRGTNETDSINRIVPNLRTNNNWHFCREKFSNHENKIYIWKCFEAIKFLCFNFQIGIRLELLSFVSFFFVCFHWFLITVAYSNWKLFPLQFCNLHNTFFELILEVRSSWRLSLRKVNHNSTF